MSNLANFVRESSFTLGTGAVVLEGALDSYASFASTVPAGMVWYSIEDGLNRESGQGFFDGDSQLERTFIESTLVSGIYTAGGDAITLTGYATVAISLTAGTIQELESSIAGPNITTKGMYENNSIISENYSITVGNNAMSSGPVTIIDGITVNIPAGSRWVIL
tara:strand:- start:442 stop:933 length:492 start_codon:yes stop_codon:yes gene_type:complete